MLSEFSSVDLVATNPWRPVDWRYRRAIGILSGEIRSNRANEDKLVWRMVQFLRRYRLLETDREQIAAREALVKRNYPIYWVMRTMRMGSVKSEMEAWLLSGKTAKELAEQSNQPVELIEAYKQMAFDIDGRRENRMFVLNIIIGDAIHRELKYDAYDTIWKFYGYMYGPVMLESLVTTTINPVQPRTAEDIVSAWRSDARGNQLRKHALATRLVPINSFTTAEISEGFHRELELDRKNDAAQYHEQAGDKTTLQSQAIHYLDKEFVSGDNTFAHPVDLGKDPEKDSLKSQYDTQ